MKEKFIKIFAILSCVVSLAAIGNAQTTSKFEIPFDFIVRDRVLPAGEYVLRSSHDGKRIWVIEGKSETKPLICFLANTVETAKRMSQSKLIFRQIENRHFLVDFTVFDYRITLPRNKSERILPGESLAKNNPNKAEIVINEANRQER